MYTKTFKGDMKPLYEICSSVSWLMEEQNRPPPKNDVILIVENKSFLCSSLKLAYLVDWHFFGFMNIFLHSTELKLNYCR